MNNFIIVAIVLALALFGAGIYDDHLESEGRYEPTIEVIAKGEVVRTRASMVENTEVYFVVIKKKDGDLEVVDVDYRSYLKTSVGDYVTATKTFIPKEDDPQLVSFNKTRNFGYFSLMIISLFIMYKSFSNKKLASKKQVG